MRNSEFYYRKKIILVLLINSISLIINLILFEITLKQDDQEMTYLLYGAYDSNYSQYILYINIIYAKFLVFCLKLFPCVPWYTVWFLIFIFLSLSIIGILFYKQCSFRINSIMYLVLSFILGHEFYIRMTFTKVSGLLIITGLLLLISFVRNINIKDFWKVPTGVSLCILGNLIRTRVYQMCIFVVLFYILFLFLCDIKKREVKKNIYKYIVFFIILYVTYIINVCANSFNVNSYLADDDWKYYFQDNTSRASLMDYGGAPDYQKYKEKYDELNISYNDYYTWWGLSWRIDTDRLNNELTATVRKIAGRYENNNKIEIYKNALANFWNNSYLNICLYVFILVFFLALLSLKNWRESLFLFVLIFGGGICAYAYLYGSGRVTHHVNVVIWMMCIAVYVFHVVDLERRDVHGSKYIIIFIILVAYLTNDYNNITSQSYVGMANGFIESEKENADRNRGNLKILSNDENHCYIFPVNEWFGTYLSTSSLEVVDKGLYHNLFNVFSSVYPVGRNIYEQYCIENPMKELCDSDVLYVACSELTRNQIACVELYLTENYSPVKATLVKKLDNIYIYKFMTSKYVPKLRHISENENIIDNVEYTISENEIIIDGCIYIPGYSSFETNIYLVVEEKDGIVKYVQLCQNFGENKEDLQGQFGYINSNIKMEEFGEINKMYFLLENDNIGYIKEIKY